MNHLTLLRVMLLITSTLNTPFPWYIWIYAIILELDYIGDTFYKSNLLKLQFELMKPTIQNKKEKEENNA